MTNLRMAVFALCAGTWAACSGGGAGTNNGSPTPSLTVTPTEWSVPAGGAAKQFTATLVGSSDPIAWSIETAGTAAEVGTVVAGLYTPPPTLAIGRDVVVKATAGTLVARATVHVGAGVGGVTLVVTPATATVVAGSTDLVTLHADTNYIGTVAWTMDPGLGTLDPATGTTVVYAAPSSFVMWDTDVVVTATAGALSDSSTITVHPTALAVTGPATVRAAGAAVDFTLGTDIGVNAVAWSLDPGTVGSITGSGSTGTFTPAASVGSSTPFQVIATVGGATGRASATLLPPATPMTITGTVVTHEGHPYAGAKVVIGGQSATSGVGGAFSIPGVVPPYDAILITDSNTHVTVFRDVSDTTPVLDFVHSGPYHTATVAGRVTFNGDGVQGATVFSAFNSMMVFDPNGVYTFATSWFGSTPEIVTHRAWVIGENQTTFRPNDYWYGTRDVDLTAGGTTTGQDITLTHLSSGLVTWTVDSEDTYVPGSLVYSIVAHFTDGSFRTIYNVGLTAFVGDLQDIVPVLPDGTVRIGWSTTGSPEGSTSVSAPVSPGQNGVALVLPAIPTAIAPDAGATGVGYATPFTWATSSVGGADGVSIHCDNGMSYRIVGGGRSATIPDLRANGISPASANCTWSPSWDSPTIDERVAGPAAVAAMPVYRSAAGADWSFSFSAP